MTHILVTGATGNIGRLVIDRLLARGATVRAASRTPSAARFPAGVEVVGSDDLTAATSGVSAVFLNARAVGEAAGDWMAAARAGGARRGVALAAINVDDDLAAQPSRFNGDRNKEAEDAVVASGLEWVSLRPTVFAGNTLLMWGAQIRAGDVVRAPYAASASAPIDERDVADVAVEALLTDALVGRRPAMTGPESLTHRELVARIGAAIGRPLSYVEIDPEVARTRISPNQAFVDALLAFQARGTDGPAAVTNEVEKALGRPARTFADWAADHAASFQAVA